MRDRHRLHNLVAQVAGLAERDMGQLRRPEPLPFAGVVWPLRHAHRSLVADSGRQPGSGGACLRSFTHRRASAPLLKRGVAAPVVSGVFVGSGALNPVRAERLGLRLIHASQPLSIT